MDHVQLMQLRRKIKHVGCVCMGGVSAKGKGQSLGFQQQPGCQPSSLTFYSELKISSSSFYYLLMVRW